MKGDDHNPRKLKRVIFFGDSICHGQHVSVDKIFVTRLAAYYNTHVVPPILVENRSINGNTSRQALERLTYDVSSHRPDLVYVQFGLNDCNVWLTDNGHPRVSPEGYKANLEEIVLKLRAAGTRTVIVATNHQCALRDDYERRVLDYDALAREAAAETQAVLFDVRALTPSFNPQAMLHPDGIHLAEAGHDWYFEALRPVLLNEVGRLREVESPRESAERRG